METILIFLDTKFGKARIQRLHRWHLMISEARGYLTYRNGPMGDAKMLRLEDDTSGEYSRPLLIAELRLLYRYPRK